MAQYAKTVEIIIRIMPRHKLTTCFESSESIFLGKLNIYHLQHYDNKLFLTRDLVRNTSLLDVRF